MNTTFETLNVTHLLISCPRGFVNERHVWAIPADCADDARKSVEANNPSGDVRYSRLVTLADADASDRSAAGRNLWGTPDEYRTNLYMDGPLAGTLEY